ncbi:helix-turn-helix transcriptional regulator [Nonomuraea endophytica]|uniref:helix-turn-helix transcriptional regulator n=1 Tax=Nonomuraea endophytica TaxID=714136 RepID=UPI0037C958E5
MLWGRQRETAVIERVVAAARAGRSEALVLRGEPGIGKSALLRHAVDVAGGARVLRGTGVESESELPFAGLHLLLHPHLGRVDALPERQAAALGAALGVAPGADGDRFLVGLAVLTLLADLAEGGPLLCLIDDAHWLDHASAEVLLFAARRLHAEGIAMIFAVRDEQPSGFSASGLPELTLDGLDPDAAASLLAERAAGLAPQVRTQILDEAGGNPLALLELPVDLHDGPPPAGGPGDGLRRAFVHRIADLPAATRRLLVVAAADDTADPAVVFGAAARLGASLTDVAAGEQASLLLFADGRLTFRHPLVRAAVYQSTPLALRLEAHRALAETLGPADADRRAWHLAAITSGPDEQVAALLEDSAERARARGGYAAMAAAYERAAALSEDRDRRGQLLLAAAEAAVDAGRLDHAGALAARATESGAGPVMLARAASIRATVADEHHRPASAQRILTSAGLAAGLDAELADSLLFRAVDSAIVAGDLPAIRETADQMAHRAPHARRASALARMAIGFGGDIADGVRALRELTGLADSPTLRELTGSPHLKELTGLAGSPHLRETALVPSWYWALGDDAGGLRLADELVRACREQGAIGVLPLALCALSRFQILLGHRHDALANAEEGLRIARDTGHRMSEIYLASLLADLAALQGDEERCRALIEDCRAQRPGLGTVLSSGASSLLALGLGRYEDVLAEQQVIEDPAHLPFTLFALPDVIEAAARTGRPEQAAAACDWYTRWAAHSGNTWAAAVAARCRALLSDHPESHYAEAVEHGASRPLEEARTRLLYGEWLRRERRRADARPHLRTALAIFEGLGAALFAERARTELRAAGESRPARQDDATDLVERLTPQELQVARLAADGLSNRAIGARLFLSPRTVGYHLSNAYPKLGVSSRTELAGLDLTHRPGPGAADQPRPPGTP